MAITINGAGTITGISAGGLPDGCVVADDLATEILDVLTEGSNVPEAGNYYVFVYRAKTPGIAYDSHPLVAVTELFQWGFRGINFHLRKYRQYTWGELGTQVYIVQQEELDDLLSLDYEKIVLNK